MRPAAARTRLDGARWADVLASLSDGLVVVDGDEHIVLVNPAAEALLGISAPHLTGFPIEEVLGGGRASAWLAALARATLRTGMVHRQPDGLLAHPVPGTTVTAACAPVHDDDGRIWGAALVLRTRSGDLALPDAATATDAFPGATAVVLGLAHEIRNPLGGIKGAAELLGRQIEDARQRRCLDVIVREVDRLDRLVGALSSLGDPPPLRLRPVNLHRILSDVLALEQGTAAWGAIRLVPEFDLSLPPISSDPDRLTQLFLNLVRNGAEALQGRGTLWVTSGLATGLHVRRGGARVRLAVVTVEDDGPGVPPELERSIFSPLVSTKARGSGLGLPLCHRIAHELDGTLTYAPRRGGGSVFRVTLPVIEAHHDDTG